MAQPQQQLVDVALSPFDQSGPWLYVHKFFCFEFPDASRMVDAENHILERLSAAVLRWPFITGRVGPGVISYQPPNNVTNLNLKYMTPLSGNVERDILVVKKVPYEEFPYTFAELAEAGMPPSVMDMKVLSSVPEWPKSAFSYPALAVQANFISGGLILCFAFHHAVADGGSFTAFIKEFGAGAPFTTRAELGVPANVEHRIQYDARHEDCGDCPDKPFPEFDWGNRIWRAPNFSHVTTRIFQFSATTVKKLEEVVGMRIKEIHGPQAWASNIACLSSLVWVAVMRARQDRLHPNENAKMGIAVNFRSVTNPPLPEDYFGNAIVHVHATMPVEDMLTASPHTTMPDHPSTIPMANVANAAWNMRRAVQGVDSSYVTQRRWSISKLINPTEVPRRYSMATDTAHSGIDFSSWRDQGADIEFNIPGTKNSKVDFWRKAWSPNEGAYNILPRKGGSKGDAVWEVSIGLCLDDMNKVCRQTELGGWVDRVLE